MALTKADISEQLFQEIGLTKRESKEIVEHYFQQLAKALQAGQQVKLSGYGNYELHDKNERPGRNPKTGEEIPVSARRVVTFRSGQKLRARVEKYAGKDKAKDGTHGSKDTAE
jgi:integration host factor subunit alpha